MAQWVDIRKIRESVTIQQILEYYGLEDDLVRKGDQLIGACPIHKGTNKSQFHVSLAKNIFRCFGDCSSNPILRNGGGNLIDLVCCLEGIEEPDDPERHKAARKAALLIQDRFALATERTPRAPSHIPAREAVAPTAPPPPLSATPETREPAAPLQNVPLKFALSHLDVHHPYLRERGFSQSTLEYFGVGYHAGRGLMQGRIAIPIANTEGSLVAYAGRWPGNELPEAEGKYKLPQGFHKSLEIFNLHRAKACAGEHGLVVVEGFFDAMRLYQHGVCHAVALMGSTLSDAQEQLIVDAVGPRGRVTLCFDGDKSGQTCTEHALERLSQRVFVRAVKLAEPIQPDNLQADEIRALFG
jgi:DNA primase